MFTDSTPWSTLATDGEVASGTRRRLRRRGDGVSPAEAAGRHWGHGLFCSNGKEGRKMPAMAKWKRAAGEAGNKIRMRIQNSAQDSASVRSEVEANLDER
jgi:hypothetical protein